VSAPGESAIVPLDVESGEWQLPSELDLAWLAGLLEGEGSFGVYPTGKGRWPVAKVQITMTDQDILQRVSDLTDHNVCGPYSKEKHGGRTPVFQISNHRKAVVAKLLLALRPLMGERRQRQIDYVLESACHLPL